MNKTFIYSVIIVLLLGANLFVFFYDFRDDGSNGSEVYFEKLSDKEIVGITITSGDTPIELTSTSDGWYLNDQVKADNGFVNTLISVLERVASGRKIKDVTHEKQGSVSLKLNDDSEISFEYTSNPNRTKSYFIESGSASEVFVPGYKDNVIDIFMLHPDQWRDRLIIDASWRTIQELNLKIKDRESLEITFVDKFFLVNGEPPQDSSAVVDYLNQFQYFEANEMISRGRFPAFDSLAGEEPLAVLQIDDINAENDLILEVFASINQQPYHLVKVGEQMTVVDAKRVNDLLATSADFLGK